LLARRTVRLCEAPGSKRAAAVAAVDTCRENAISIRAALHFLHGSELPRIAAQRARAEHGAGSIKRRRPLRAAV